MKCKRKTHPLLNLGVPGEKEGEDELGTEQGSPLNLGILGERINWEKTEDPPLSFWDKRNVIINWEQNRHPLLKLGVPGERELGVPGQKECDNELRTEQTPPTQPGGPWGKGPAENELGQE